MLFVFVGAGLRDVNGIGGYRLTRSYKGYCGWVPTISLLDILP